MMRALVLAAAASAAILEPIGYDREGSALAFLTNAGVEATAADVADLNKDAPSLVAMLAMATDAPEQLADLIKASPMSVIADEVDMPAAGAGAAALPVVVAHGMGDSCYNSGMKSITEAAGKKLNAYATCVPTAEGWLFDTIDGFLKNRSFTISFALSPSIRRLICLASLLQHNVLSLLKRSCISANLYLYHAQESTFHTKSRSGPSSNWSATAVIV